MSHGRHLHLSDDNLTARRTAQDAVEAALVLVHDVIYGTAKPIETLYRVGVVLEHCSVVKGGE
ncbi:hypothetical protein EDD33_2665 [Nocardioides aurantiacus]|uniref:Uncharacterized protein n=1 Tax=Nocardioides aurantiacus TaxID=86796 RepID=A0A3N2CVZ0_9ACTN|nr:hypothetical protein EDD33_2587 [Nocardioides aurantiacus]ROR91790.1 hypothetical protein EDD33_2665 [Nocardioides aurantiacus]